MTKPATAKRQPKRKRTARSAAARGYLAEGSDIGEINLIIFGIEKQVHELDSSRQMLLVNAQALRALRTKILSKQAR